MSYGQLTLTKREQELLELRKLEGKNFRRSKVADKWKVSGQTVLNTLNKAGWKLRLLDFFPILALNGRVINQLGRFYDDGYSMEGVALMSEVELLKYKLVGSKSLPALRALAEALIRMPQERRKEAQDFLFGAKVDR